MADSSFQHLFCVLLTARTKILQMLGRVRLHAVHRLLDNSICIFEKIGSLFLHRCPHTSEWQEGKGVKNEKIIAGFGQNKSCDGLFKRALVLPCTGSPPLVINEVRIYFQSLIKYLLSD